MQFKDAPINTVLGWNPTGQPFHMGVFGFAGTSLDGTIGLVPKPLAGQQNYVLSGSGWVVNSGGGGGSSEPYPDLTENTSIETNAHSFIIQNAEGSGGPIMLLTRDEFAQTTAVVQLLSDSTINLIFQNTIAGTSSILNLDSGLAKLAHNGATGSTFIELNNSGGVINSTIAAFGGLKYNADYSANYTNRSLVDKGYLDAAIGGFGGSPYPDLTEDTSIEGGEYNFILGTISSPVSNFIVETNDEVRLKSLNSSLETVTDFYLNSNGSAGLFASNSLGMTMNLDFTAAGVAWNLGGIDNKFSFTVEGTNVTLTDGPGLQYDADYSANYTVRSLVDKGYVDSRAGWPLDATPGVFTDDVFIDGAGKYLNLGGWGGAEAIDEIYINTLGGVWMDAEATSLTSNSGHMRAKLASDTDFNASVSVTPSKVSANVVVGAAQNASISTVLSLTGRVGGGFAPVIGRGIRLEFSLQGSSGSTMATGAGITYLSDDLAIATFRGHYDFTLHAGSSTAVRIVQLDRYGFRYEADYSANYTDRSLVDRGAMTAAITAATAGGGATTSHLRFRFNSSLYTEDEHMFKGPVTTLTAFKSANINAFTFEVRTDASSTWTACADVAAILSWTAVNVTVSGTLWWIRCLATYTTGTGIGEVFFTYI